MRPDTGLEGPERDFLGYGPNPPLVTWPGKARVAISLVVNYEAGAEYSLAAGDGRQDTVGEFGVAINPTDRRVRDLCTESTFEYESRAGVWRLARMLDEFEVPATFYVCGRALDLNPEVGHYIQESGHEPCAHGWRWEELWRLSEEDEREHLHRAIESIARACGSRPVGWFSRCTPSVRTRRLVVEEGGFLYDSDAYNDDLPYYVRVGDRDHLVIPYSFAYNDMRFAFPGFADPMSFYTYLTMALDELWLEGEHHPKMMSIGLHPRWTGQAARAGALRRFLEYARAKGGVWFARRVDIANHWREHHPHGATPYPDPSSQEQLT
jgi:peptidoglycan/xylan/chitin deacetylase (PgdA/CDA1 family)